MSYVSKRTRGPRVHRGLGGFLDDVLGFATNVASSGAIGQQAAVDAACTTQSDQAIAPIDAQIVDVQNNWNPTGFYTRDQMNQAMAFILDMKIKAGAAVDAAERLLQVPAQRAVLDRANQVRFADNIDPQPFTSALQAAAAQGIDVIDASGFKRWVVNSLKAARACSYAAQFVNCARPALLGVLQSLSNAIDAVVSFLKTIGQLLLDLGKLALKVPDTISSLLTFAKWAAIIGGGYWLGVKAGLVPHQYDLLHLKE